MMTRTTSTARALPAPVQLGRVQALATVPYPVLESNPVLQCWSRSSAGVLERSSAGVLECSCSPVVRCWSPLQHCSAAALQSPVCITPFSSVNSIEIHRSYSVENTARVIRATDSQTWKKCRHAWGTFWMAREHFEPKYTLFCYIVKFVGKYALLTLFLRIKL